MAGGVPVRDGIRAAYLLGTVRARPSAGGGMGPGAVR